MSLCNHHSDPFDDEPLSFEESGLGEFFALDDMLLMNDGLIQDSHHGSNVDDLDRLFADEDDATAALLSDREDQAQRPSLHYHGKRFESVQEEMRVGPVQPEADGRHRQAESLGSTQEDLDKQQQHFQALQIKPSTLQQSNDYVPTSSPRRCSSNPLGIKKQGQNGSRPRTSRVNVASDPAPYNHELYQEQVRRVSENDASRILKETQREFKSHSWRSKKSCSPPKRRARKSAKQGRRMSANDVDETSSSGIKFHYSQANGSMHTRKQRRVTLDSASAPTLDQLLGHSSPASMTRRQDPRTMSGTLEYHEALMKLAESMKRTELSRRQLIMQRTALTLDHDALQRRHSFTSADHGLASVVSVARNCSYHSQAPLTTENRLSNVGAFLAGERHTLPNGLEQSRRQLKMYVDYVSSRV